MPRLFKLTLILACAAALAACSTVHRLTAANDVHALLVSIRDNDQATFDAHVDREALKTEIEGRLMEQTHKSKTADSWGSLGAMLAPAIAKYAGDSLIQPKMFRQVADFYGYKASSPPPSTLAIASMLKPLPDGRVCATKKKDGPCMLMFTQTAGVWRLSSFEGDMSMLRIKL
ncbi:MAG: DUF2939 domain-containing protein [Caulobacteraceae bacterium]